MARILFPRKRFRQLTQNQFYGHFPKGVYLLEDYELAGELAAKRFLQGRVGAESRLFELQASRCPPNPKIKLPFEYLRVDAFAVEQALTEEELRSVRKSHPDFQNFGLSTPVAFLYPKHRAARPDLQASALMDDSQLFLEEVARSEFGPGHLLRDAVRHKSALLLLLRHGYVPDEGELHLLFTFSSVEWPVTDSMSPREKNAAVIKALVGARRGGEPAFPESMEVAVSLEKKLK